MSPPGPRHFKKSDLPKNPDSLTRGGYVKKNLISKKKDRKMTAFPPKLWLSAPCVGAPTPLPSSRTPFVPPRRGSPVGIGTSFGYLRATTILTDRISGELIDLILLPTVLVPYTI